MRWLKSGPNFDSIRGSLSRQMALHFALDPGRDVIHIDADVRIPCRPVVTPLFLSKDLLHAG